jgi:hypothetical protein
MRTFECVCSHTLFFENIHCGNCGRDVGWCPVCRSITSLDPAGIGRYRCTNPACGALLALCTNYAQEHVCNRCVAVDATGAAAPFCDTCRFNHTIPDLSVPGNRERWARLESAKRRLFYALDLMGLPYGTAADGFDPAIAFDFKGDIIVSTDVWRTMGELERVYTGHANGKITINIREADDCQREQLRVDMGEAHRTLIGHFRHEIGHYFWDLLVKDHYEEDFRQLFGDPMNPSYQDALERHYRDGPPADWHERHVSAYATMHPWEDWAETFALYLDVVSVLDTAQNMGLIPTVSMSDLNAMIRQFSRLGLILNEVNREMGLIDVVPEVITLAIMEKMAFVHRVLRDAARQPSIAAPVADLPPAFAADTPPPAA